MWERVAARGSARGHLRDPAKWQREGCGAPVLWFGSSLSLGLCDAESWGEGQDNLPLCWRAAARPGTPQQGNSGSLYVALLSRTGTFSGLHCYKVLVWPPLSKSVFTDRGRLWSYAFLLSARLEIMGKQDAARWCVLLAPVGGEGRIFTYRWSYPTHRVWNWGFSLCFAASVLRCKSSPLEAILQLGLRDTFLGFRDFGCKRKNCMWVTPSSDVTVRAIRRVCHVSLKRSSQSEHPRSRLSPDTVAVMSALVFSSSSHQREPHLAAKHQLQLTWHAFKTLMQYELYVSII